MEHIIARLIAGNMQHLFFVACIIAVIAVFGRGLNRFLPVIAGKVKPKALLIPVMLGAGLFLLKDKLVTPPDPAQVAYNEHEELLALGREIDDLHASGVSGERHNYRRHYSYGHLSGQEVYHNGCSACERNYEIRKRMDAIYYKHPDWVHGGYVPPPPLPGK